MRKQKYMIAHDGYFSKAEIYQFEGTEEELMEHLGYGKTAMDDWEADSDNGLRPTLEFMKERFREENGDGMPFYQVMDSKGKQIF